MRRCCNHNCKLLRSLFLQAKAGPQLHATTAPFRLREEKDGSFEMMAPFFNSLTMTSSFNRWVVNFDHSLSMTSSFKPMGYAFRAEYRILNPGECLPGMYKSEVMYKLAANKLSALSFKLVYW